MLAKMCRLDLLGEMRHTHGSPPEGPAVSRERFSNGSTATVVRRMTGRLPGQGGGLPSGHCAWRAPERADAPAQSNTKNPTARPRTGALPFSEVASHAEECLSPDDRGAE